MRKIAHDARLSASGSTYALRTVGNAPSRSMPIFATSATNGDRASHQMTRLSRLALRQLRSNRDQPPSPRRDDVADGDPDRVPRSRGVVAGAQRGSDHRPDPPRGAIWPGRAAQDLGDIRNEAAQRDEAGELAQALLKLRRHVLTRSAG